MATLKKYSFCCELGKEQAGISECSDGVYYKVVDVEEFLKQIVPCEAYLAIKGRICAVTNSTCVSQCSIMQHH